MSNLETDIHARASQDKVVENVEKLAPVSLISEKCIVRGYPACHTTFIGREEVLFTITSIKCRKFFKILFRLSYTIITGILWGKKYRDKVFCEQ